MLAINGSNRVLYVFQVAWNSCFSTIWLRASVSLRSESTIQQHEAKAFHVLGCLKYFMASLWNSRISLYTSARTLRIAVSSRKRRSAWSSCGRLSPILSYISTRSFNASAHELET